MRIRTFFEPLFVVDDDLEVQPFLAESITPNEDSTVCTIKVREGITFTDGTPLNADAAIDNLNRTQRPARPGALKDLAKNPDGRSSPRSSTTTRSRSPPARTAIPTSRSRGRCSRTSSPAQAGFIASPTWLAAVDGDPDLATQPVGTGPFIVQEYLPGDRMTVDQEPRLLAQGRRTATSCRTSTRSSSA